MFRNPSVGQTPISTSNVCLGCENPVRLQHSSQEARAAAGSVPTCGDAAAGFRQNRPSPRSLEGASQPFADLRPCRLASAVSCRKYPAQNHILIAQDCSTCSAQREPQCGRNRAKAELLYVRRNRRQCSESETNRKQHGCM